MLWWVLSGLAVIGVGYEVWKWLFGDREVANGWDICGECPFNIRPGDSITWNKAGQVCHLRCV